MVSELIALVVEDNEDLNDIFSSAVEKAGYISQSVYDGAEALLFLSKSVPAMVILDLHMPKVGGDVVLKNIRSDQRMEDTTVIVVTADATFADALQLQKEMLLLKPVSFSQLSEIASRFVPKQDSLTQS
jgi:CheY-like chemotaxis protein